MEVYQCVVFVVFYFGVVVPSGGQFLGLER